MTHNTDFAKGFIGLLGNSQTIGHAFHITSDEVLNWNQIYRSIGKAVGVFDNSKIKRFVPEFKAAVPFVIGIKQSVQWFEAHSEKCTIDTEWNDLMDKIIKSYETGVEAPV